MTVSLSIYTRLSVAIGFGGGSGSPGCLKKSNKTIFRSSIIKLLLDHICIRNSINYKNNYHFLVVAIQIAIATF